MVLVDHSQGKREIRCLPSAETRADPTRSSNFGYNALAHAGVAREPLDSIGQAQCFSKSRRTLAPIGHFVINANHAESTNSDSARPQRLMHCPDTIEFIGLSKSEVFGV